MISNKSAAGSEAKVVLSSAELLKGGRTVFIVHEGQEYRLQLTKNGKLILTK